MSEIHRTLLLALGILIAISVIVGATLRHHIGGFIQTVAREAREQEEREAREEAEREAREREKREDMQAEDQENPPE